MADYIYLLENRLSRAQQNAINEVREIARAKGLTVFLVGGAVRDLTSGSPVRDLDVVVQGNALKLKKELEKAGALITGENDPAQSLFARFPGSVRMEIGSTLSVTYPKPGKPVVKPATILEDLRRRDFTANAMALSLNQGSYGLLMDPLNGVADIENRELRLVSNYGFIEDPVRMIRAARYAARLGWQLEEKTLARYDTGKTEGYISALQEFPRGYETEEIVHEEDPLRVMRRLESEGWMKVLAPAWSSAKANVPELEKLREAQLQLQIQGVLADPSAAQFPLLTAKLSPKDIADLKQMFPRKGFVAEIEAIEGEAKAFATELSSKQAASASATWKLLVSARPEVVLWVAYSTRSASLQAKFKSFYTEWPQARTKIPYTLMQEMRIVPELPGYEELVEKLFFELMDGKLGTVEEMKAYLEPFSPPAPPPPVHLRRARATKKDAKAAKSRKKAETEAEEDDGLDVAAIADLGEIAEPLDDDSEDTEEKPVQSKPVAVKPAEPKPAAPAKVPAPAKAVPAKVAVKAPPVKAIVAKTFPAKKATSVKAVAKKAVPVKLVPKKAVPAKVAAKKTAPIKTSSAKKSASNRSPAKVAAKAAVPKAKFKVATKIAVKSAKRPSRTQVKQASKAGAKAAAKHSSRTPAKKKR